MARFWFWLLRLSARGMNTGLAGHVSISGEAALLRSFARLWQAPVVIDVGANVGDYASLVLQIIPGASLHCFEPTRHAFDQLRGRIASPAAQLNQQGLSSAPAELMIHSDRPGSSRSSLHAIDASHRGMVHHPTEKVTVVTLDDYARNRGLASIQLLKLDIEGHELEALKGARGLLESGAIDVIQFEFGGCNIASRTFIKDFMKLLGSRYRLYKLFQNGLWEVPGYHELLEIFDTSNWVAVRTDLNLPVRF